MELLLPLRVQWLFGQCLLYCFCIFRGDVIRTWETQIPVKFSTIFCLISWVVCVHRGFSGGSVVKSPPAVQETWVWTWVGKICWSTALSPTPVLLPEVSQGQKSLVGCMQSMGLQRVRHDWSDEHLSPCGECIASLGAVRYSICVSPSPSPRGVSEIPSPIRVLKHIITSGQKSYLKNQSITKNSFLKLS